MAEKNASPYTGEALYKLTPKDAPDTVLVNCGEGVVVIPQENDGSASVRLLKGDRVDSPKYADKLVGKIPGLARLKSLATEHAKKLEHEQRVRAGLELDDYTKEARARKGKEPDAAALAGDDEFSRAIREGRAEKK